MSAAPNPYPPEVQALVDAAATWRDSYAAGLDAINGGGPAAELREAVDAYRKLIRPPEPFEAYVGVLDDGKRCGTAVYTERHILVKHWPQVWRCTVTPVERVK